MNAKLVLTLISAAFFPLAAAANQCSGGKDGGMDATGNQCNDPMVIATAATDRDTATSASTAEKSKQAAEPRARKTAKRSAATANAGTRTRLPHG